jgi:hypothetical protein
MSASQTPDPGEPSTPISLPLHLSIYPDTDEDQAIEPLLPGMMLALMHGPHGVPERVLHPCMACMQPCLYLLARDSNQPSIVFGGAICSNNDCTVASLSIVGDPSGE